MQPLAALHALAALAVLAGSPGAQQYVATQPPVLASPLFFRTGATGDVDGDGDRDLVACSGLFFTPRLFVNDGAGSFMDATATLPLPPGGVQAMQSTTLVDFDGDGDLDLFVSAMVGSYLLRNLGGGTWAIAANALPPSLPPGTFVAADFDGDGDQDLAGAGWAINYGRNQLLENVGGRFVARDPFPGGAFDIAAADIDGDGDFDLCVTGHPRLYRNDGQLVFTDVTATRLPPLLPQVTICRFGDLDGDGAPELVLNDVSGNADVVLRNVGGSYAVAPAVLLPVVTPTGGLTLADVDDDGDLDLLRTRTNAGPLLSRNDGAGGAHR